MNLKNIRKSRQLPSHKCYDTDIILHTLYSTVYIYLARKGLLKDVKIVMATETELTRLVPRLSLSYSVLLLICLQQTLGSEASKR